MACYSGGAKGLVLDYAGDEGAEVEVLKYEVPSYTGLVYPMEKYYPTWVLEEDHPAVQAAVALLSSDI